MNFNNFYIPFSSSSIYHSLFLVRYSVFIRVLRLAPPLSIFDFMDLNLSTEEKLLLTLSNLTFTEKQKSEIVKLVSEEISWPDFIKLANDHGISALVCNNLKELSLINIVPEQETTFLEGAYLKSLSRNTILLEKFLELQSILEDAGISPVLIKGMAMELTAWGNMGLRQMNDIDLYVEPDKALDAWKLLKTMGYVSLPMKSRLHHRFLMLIGKHLPELHKDGISFEIHHNLFRRLETGDRRPESINSFKLDVEDYHCNIPEINTHFLFLIEHLAYHEKQGEAQIRQYMDLCQLITQRTHDVKKSGILELAEEYSLTDSLLSKFYQLHIFWGMSLPEEVQQQISNKQKQEALDVFLKFLRQPKGHASPGHEQEYRKIVKLIPGFGNKILYTIGDFFPSLSFMKQRYNTLTRFTAFFYYPIRLLKIIIRALKH